MSDAEFVKRASAILPNSAFDAARIIVNPRCVTTYAGVSHTQLAMDLFGSADGDEIDEVEGGKYALDESDWRHAPETFVCQEVSFCVSLSAKPEKSARQMRTTGGRAAPKQQRRTGFYMYVIALLEKKV